MPVMRSATLSIMYPYVRYSMNFAIEPVAWAWRYRNSATSLSVVLLARDEVEGFGGRDARKSP